ncbi:MAG TPA: CocE/NonD family hydrolase [bacterium]|nr:CocE/NonD family hydrolase [bacterium]
MARSGNVSVTQDTPVRMRDGVTLYADVYIPEGNGPFPVLLMRTPYNKTAFQDSVYAHPGWYARRGYIVVIEDVRGRWSSEGEWYPFAHESEDGYDTVEWAARLPRSNGKVGMYGLSYVGATQLLASVTAPPHLACIAPGMTASEYYDGWTYRGGAYHLAFTESWTVMLAADTARRRELRRLEAELYAAFNATGLVFGTLPLKQYELLRRERIAPYFFDWLDHPTRDEYWERWSIERRHANVRVPALHIAGWYDIFLDGSIRNYLGLRERAADDRARNGQRILISPWMHVPWAPLVSGWDFGDEARSRINEWQLRWFDYWLRGVENGVPDDPPVRIFVMGENRWRDEREWPLRRAQTTEFFLHSQGSANSLNGDGVLSRERPGEEDTDVFIYDPRSPTMSFGGRSCCRYTISPMGPADQRPAEIHNGVLVYSTPPLLRDLEVTGPLSAVLYAATTARDTDWTVKFVDVYPDGRAINVADGILRARYRDSLSVPMLLTPGEVYEYRVDLGSTSNLFKAGHRIRVEVSSSNFPCFDRNLNTGNAPGDEWIADCAVATQTVFHDANRPSRIVLPVVPRP